MYTSEISYASSYSIKIKPQNFHSSFYIPQHFRRSFFNLNIFAGILRGIHRNPPVDSRHENSAVKRRRGMRQR